MNEMMTVKQTAEFLQVTTRTILRRVKAGDIKVIRISERTIRIPKSQFEGRV